MARFLVLCALPLLILAACSESDRPATVTDNVTQTVTESVDTSAEVPLVVDVSSIVAAPVPLPAVVDPDPTPVALRPVPDSLPDIDPRAVDFIVREEVISSAYYTRKLQRPICPACRTTPSGPTVGIGSDLGHLSHAGVDEFWVEHPQRERLHTGVGFTGKAAIPVTATLQDVLTPYDLAYRVFAHKQLIAFYYSCRRAFGPKNWDRARRLAQGMLLATCYNRGTGMVGSRRAELREIRDTSLPELNYSAMADALRRSKRHFSAPGLLRRYDETARLMETP